nr:glypican-5 isoform X10 [Zonotrichia albicollis]XP_026649538.1 glypican-5 isoform X10 [Zonotrichia albicollis]
MLIRLAENYTSTLFCNAYRNMAAEAAVHVQEFFTDVGLFLFGTDASTEEFVNRFFDTLFPVVYNHVINPGPTDISLEYAECLRAARRDIRPFGSIPRKAIGQMGRSLLPSRTLLQALNLGVEVINTTDHLPFSRECSRALLRMQYCPQCQGLTLSKPCLGYCLNILRGCLAHLAEVDLHWQGYIQALEELSGALSGAHSIEHVLLNFHSLVHNALVQAGINGPEVSEQVNKICGPPVRKPKQSPGCSFDQNKDNQVLKMFSRDSEQTLTNRRKEFIRHLRPYRAFYGGLADQLCANELAAADGLPCWNGEDLVGSYTRRVVGSGIKAQSANPEVKVKGTDPVIRQIIDKLKHVVQLLQGKSFPKYDKWDLQQTGSGGGVDEQISGDCDDEDGCGGSGSGEFKRVLKITDLFKNFQHPLPAYCFMPPKLEDKRHTPYFSEEDILLCSGFSCEERKKRRTKKNTIFTYKDYNSSRAPFWKYQRNPEYGIREIQNMVLCGQGIMQVVSHLTWYAIHQNKVDIFVEIDTLCGNGLIKE